MQPASQLEQIEQQVSAGLPPDGPHIISQQPTNDKKNLLINILLALGIVGMGSLSLFLLISVNSSHKNKIAQISPTPTIITLLHNEYANPFDENTSYSNPFSQNTNPFDNLQQ